MNRIKEHKKLFAGILAGVIVLIAVIVLLITKPFKKSAAGQPEETQTFAAESESEKEPSSETEKASRKETKEKETKKESKTTEADTTTEEDTSAPETVPNVTEASSKPVATEAPTTAPTAAPTKPVATAAPTVAPTPAPTQAPTQPPETTAPVVHGKDGKILDTLYVHLSNGKLWQFPESGAQIVEQTGSEESFKRYDYQGYEEDNSYMEDLLGIGILFRKTTLVEVEKYFGTPYLIVGYDSLSDSYSIAYKYKDTDLYVDFNFFNSDKTFRMVLVGTAKALEYDE